MAVQGLNGYQDFDKWKLGLNTTKELTVDQKTPVAKQSPVAKELPVDQKIPVDKQPPVEPSYEIKDPFGLNAYGGVTGVEGTPGVFGVGRVTPTDGWVQGIDGTRISRTNSQGYVGCSEVATSPFAGKGQAGYSEKPGFEPELKNLFG